MTTLLPEISIYWARAVCEIRSASYGSKHVSQPLSNTTFCAYMYLHSQLKNDRSYMEILHSAGLLCYWRCLFSVLDLDGRYDWRVMAPSMHCSLFPTSNLCVLTNITWKLQVIHVYGHSAYRTTTLLSKTFLVYARVAWGIQLESYGTRHTSVVLWYNIFCVYCKPVHSSLFVVQLRMTTKSTYLITAYYTPNDCFTANDASFYESIVN